MADATLEEVIEFDSLPYADGDLPLDEAQRLIDQEMMKGNQKQTVSPYKLFEVIILNIRTNPHCWKC